jgi:DNA-binding MarR family transcriptional regulator
MTIIVIDWGNQPVTQIEQMVDALHGIFMGMNLMYYTGVRRGAKKTVNDFTMIELHVLKRIVQAGGQMALKEIRYILDIPNSTLTSLMKRLEASRAITRTDNASDGRSSVIIITPFGREINTQHICMDREIARTFISRLENEEEADLFIRLAHKATREPLIGRVFLESMLAEDTHNMKESL